MKKYQDRYKVLNENANEKDVLDSIDRPIRPLVLEFNRIGLPTVFSCCGYTYDNEEEPKSHGTASYIQFYPPKPGDSIATTNFFKLASVSRKLGWILESIGEIKWIIRFRPPTGADEEWGGTPDDPAIHDYEHRALAINRLQKWTNSTLNTVNWQFALEDGNRVYHEKFEIEQWQVQPKKTTKIDVKPKQKT